MLYIKVKKFVMFLMAAFVLSSVLCATEGFAAEWGKYDPSETAPLDKTGTPINSDSNKGSTTSNSMQSTGSTAMFSNLTGAGGKIFSGMQGVIYLVSGFGIIGVAIGGFFGKINWRWLSAVIIGLVVISLTAGILNYLVEKPKQYNVTGAIISANGQ